MATTDDRIRIWIDFKVTGRRDSQGAATRVGETCRPFSACLLNCFLVIPSIRFFPLS